MSKKMIVAVAALSAMAGTAMADAFGTIDMKSRGAATGRSGIKVEYDGGSGYTTLHNGFAGSLRHEFGNNGTGEGVNLNGKTLEIFCTEMNERTNGAFNGFDICAPEDLPVDGNNGQLPDIAGNADRLRALYACAIADGYLNADGSWSGAPTANQTDNRNAAAAFQIMVWEAAYENDAGGIGLGAGDVRITFGGPNAAGINSFVSIFSNYINKPGGFSAGGLRGLAADGIQDQLVVVPLPPAAWAGIATLAFAGGVGYVRRRSLRAQA